MLKNQETKDQVKELRQQLKNFSETTTADEISETLSLMLDTFITDSEYSLETKANAATLVMKLSKFAFLYEKVLNGSVEQKKQPVSIKQLATIN